MLYTVHVVHDDGGLSDALFVGDQKACEQFIIGEEGYLNPAYLICEYDVCDPGPCGKLD